MTGVEVIDPAAHHERALIVDFGSQVTQLIARRLRENGVYCEIHPYNRVDGAFLSAYAPKAIVLSGGPASVSAAESPRADAAVFEHGVPILGICYGEQTICAQLGGAVAPAREREFGRAVVTATAESPLFEGVWGEGDSDTVWMSHGDRVDALPDGFHPIAVSPKAPFAAIADETRRIYGVQFHPEVAHTPRGGAILRNFTHRIAGMHGDWTMRAFRSEAEAAIRAQVGEGRVICGLSGGVDSSVAAVLLHEAIGDQLLCVFVDTGLMRAGEGEEVVRLFRNHYNIPLIHVQAEDLFLSKLAGVTDPERKRKIIGAAFIDVFEAEATKAGGADFLAQGTLYPDVIESVSFDGGPSVTIKSHHNVGGLPERMNLALVEPLRELFKDEVRALGRHILRQADTIYLEEIRAAGLYDEIWQAFAVLLPVRTVGVMGDERTYDYVCALRAVTSTDGMTADSYPFDHAFLSTVAARIVNEVRGVNRVVYDVTSKPPGTIEWE